MSVLAEVRNERERQDTLWGQQDHPNGTGEENWRKVEGQVKTVNDRLVGINQLTWMDILLEEVVEAFGEADPSRLREELIQVAAVATAWVESIDRRGDNTDE